MDSDYEVQRILREKDYYKMLKVSRTTTDEEIKKSYRKIATAVHPDHCHNEKATEAFQNLSHAYKTLSDPAQRHQYDQYGDTRPPTYNEYMAHQRFRERIDPNLYAYIFGNARPRRPRPRQNVHRQQDPEPNGVDILYPFFFIILLFLLIGNFSLPSMSTMFTSLATRANLKGIISFDKNEIGSSSTQRTSTKYNVKYFLPNWWIQNNQNMINPSTLNKIDKVADELYQEELDIKCELEKNTLNREGPQCLKKQKILGTM